MTDKNDLNQEGIHKVFERLNDGDGLQPSAELDAMILNMAADEVEENATAEEKTNITDISFRRGRRDSHQALKKKGLIPSWAMPIGLAATVLISFGVVNRVMQSPEFNDIAQSKSAAVLSDEAVVLNELIEERVNAEQGITDTQQSADHKIQISPQTEMDLEGFNKDDSSFVATPELSRQIQNSGRLDSNRSVVSQELVVESEEQDAIRESIKNERLEVNLQEEAAQASIQKQHADAARVKRERLLQSEKKSQEALRMEKPPVLETTANLDEVSISPVLEAPSAVVISSSPQGSRADALGDIVANDTDNQIQSAAAPVPASPPVNSVEQESLDSLGVDSDLQLEEIIVTAAKRDTSNVNVKQKALLTSILFEHKECQLAQDCSLLALECDACDCLEAVGSEYVDEYLSEFSETEIAQQCINTSVECVRNYCQVEQAE